MTAANLPSGPEKVRVVRNMFDTIAPRYEMVNRFISFGLDTRWRRLALRRLELSPGSLVLDLACGTGDFCRLLQANGLTPLGIDSSFGMLEHARTTASLIQADALRLPARDGAVDGVTCGFALRNFVALSPFFAEVARVVRPGGRIAFLDAARPENRVVRTGHQIWFGHVVPRIGGLLSDRSAYSYLPKSLSYLPPPEDLLDALRTAGFFDARREALTFGAAQLITATRD